MRLRVVLVAFTLILGISLAAVTYGSGTWPARGAVRQALASARTWIYSPAGEVSEWLKVLLSKSSVVNRHRGFESRPLRQAFRLVQARPWPMLVHVALTFGHPALGNVLLNPVEEPVIFQVSRHACGNS